MSSLLADGLNPLMGSAFLPEVLITSDASGQLWNSCVWDPNSGAALKSFKGSVSAPRTMSFLNNTYLISGQPSKPVLNVWQVNRHDQQPSKITTPGPVSALAASNNYIIGATGEKIYVWQATNGSLLRILEGSHYQDITCLAFTDDSSHFISAGKDGNVVAWCLFSVVARTLMPGQSMDSVSNPTPRFTWADHKLPVTDIHISSGGIRSRIFSSSLDQTCKMFSLLSGQLLLDIHLGVKLCSVTIDNSETKLFAGSENGKIHAFPIAVPPRNIQVMRSDDNCTNFVGHTSAVTCLSVSIDGELLASGSNDQTVKLWAISSAECIRTIDHKGKITTTLFVIPSNGLIGDPDSFKPSLTLSQLQKTLLDEKSQDVIVNLFVYEDTREKLPEHTSDASALTVQDNDMNKIEADHLANGEHNEEVARLKAANLKLYKFALKHVLNSDQKEINQS